MIKMNLIAILNVLCIGCLLSSSLLAECNREKYFIAIKKNEGDVLNTLDSYDSFLPPKNRFYADPMLFKHQGVNYVFFEDFNYEKGVISYITVGQDMAVSKANKVLDLPCHLSFPHVFCDEEEIYMTPETYDYKSVSLFKASHFPDQWEHQRVLVKGQHFSDPILFKHNGYYWLFVAVNKDRLRIYYAESLTSEFRPHPINHRNIRGRNAGPVYYINGKLIRPTMDCRKRYGRSMVLKKITTLDPSYFEEQDIAYIEPNWASNLDGTHSYCQNEDLVIYDGYRIICDHEDAQYSSTSQCD
jgi:hypothetical protein